MKRKSVLNGIVPVCTLAALLGAALLFAACPTDGGDDTPTGEPDSVSYTVTFTAGTGSGTPPAPMTVTRGTAITLPGQDDMIPPEDQTFDGWRTGDIPYTAGASFTVTADTEFTAEWESSIDPNKTYVRFNNPEQFPVIIYSDPSRQQEVARVPAEGTKVVEAEPTSKGIALYPSFLLTIEEISITQDAPAWLVRIDARKVNKMTIPALTSMKMDLAYIKIENAGVHSLTFNQGNYELIPLGAASNIIMSGETASYEVQPGDVNQNQYSVKENTSVPLAFPATAQWLNRGVIYTLKYTGGVLTLSSTGSILQSVPPVAPASLTATAMSWNTIDLAWESVPGAIAYAVYQAKGSGSLELVKELSGLTYTDTVFAANTVCAYQVKAVSDKSGEGPASPSASATTGEFPSSLSATATSWNSVELAWESVSGTLSYKFYRAKGSGSLELVEELSGLSHTDTGLRYDTTYTYQVWAKSDTVEGPVTPNVSATTEDLPEGQRSTVSSAAKMAAALALFNNEENTEWAIALTGSFSVNALALSDRSSNASNAVLTITSKGAGEKTLSLASLSIGSGVSLILDENVTLEGLDTGNRLVQINSGGAFTMEADSKVHGNTGGGVEVNGGTFFMKGGEISGNSISDFSSSGSASAYGGGVYVEGGTFTMSGGAITGNSVSASSTYSRLNGGYYVQWGGGSYDWYGNYVEPKYYYVDYYYSYGDAYAHGGGVYVGSSGTFTKSGGTISGNTASASTYGKASASGSAVYVSLSKKREDTVGEGDSLDSEKSGSDGGWE